MSTITTSAPVTRVNMVAVVWMGSILIDVNVNLVILVNNPSFFRGLGVGLHCSKKVLFGVTNVEMKFGFSVFEIGQLVSQIMKDMYRLLGESSPLDPQLLVMLGCKL